MSTTTSRPSTVQSSATSLAASAKFKTFAIVFSLTAPVVYVLCELFSLPLFTYHPATNRIDFGWAPGRSGEGPAMYWYGWIANSAVGASALGVLAALLPEKIRIRIPLALAWIAPVVLLPVLIYSLKFYWRWE